VPASHTEWYVSEVEGIRQRKSLWKQRLFFYDIISAYLSVTGYIIIQAQSLIALGLLFNVIIQEA